MRALIRACMSITVITMAAIGMVLAFITASTMMMPQLIMLGAAATIMEALITGAIATDTTAVMAGIITEGIAAVDVTTNIFQLALFCLSIVLLGYLLATILWPERF